MAELQRIPIMWRTRAMACKGHGRMGVIFAWDKCVIS